MKKSISYIDLFAGCGGLSLGLEGAGFSLALSVEKSDMAAHTFYHNFIAPSPGNEGWKEYSGPGAPLREQIGCKLVVKELAELLKSPETLKGIREKEIGLVAGGPPCQGFSLAGRRNPNDVRNSLPWQFLDFVEAVSPRAVVIENVSGIQQDFIKHGEKAPFAQLRIALSQAGSGYVVQPLFLNAMHYGVPQHRPRVILIGMRADIAKKHSIEVTPATWKSHFSDAGDFPEGRFALIPKPTTAKKEVLTVEHAFYDIGDNGYLFPATSIKYRRRAGAFSRAMRKIGTSTENSSMALENHTLRKHSPDTANRFRLYQYLREQGIPPNIMNIPLKHGGTLDEAAVEVARFLGEASMPAVSPDRHVLARSRNALASLVIRLATKKHSQRALSLHSPSPTVVSLPDDFVHPALPRTLTVREMARLQSFPDDFAFMGKETTGSLRRRFEVPQYTQVGNAVPPRLALAVGKLVARILAN